MRRRASNGEPLAWLFEVARKHKDKKDCLIWPYGRGSGGYGRVWYRGLMQLSHRVMCRKIHGKPPTKYHEARHLCGKGHEGCINPHHLKWGTANQNAADKIRHGTDGIGERHPGAKMTEAKVRKIPKLKRLGYSDKEIAYKFGVSRETIRRARVGFRWKHIER